MGSAQAVVTRHNGVTLGPDSAEALRTALGRSLQHCLDMNGGHHVWDIAPISQRHGITEPEFVMLTISAYTFRAILLLHYAVNDATRSLAAEILKTPADKLTAERFLDCLCELGNTICGDLKRELNKVDPHLGMSTPNRLHGATLNYAGELHASFETHMRARRESQPVFAVSLYLCAYRDVDFHVLQQVPTASDVGASALELF